ncbi:1-(5-phosphoribosyl)-5-[(5-phosphoribosylamino)methylideneamino]imidazole-4-carboxamide isomerase [Candidatus Marinamargulisbacteria bacterium SCGC AG-414-C22]|nr:1-(5-phosphoribosyl)-5-[(5-phosphoribosylamino)methylideneamino]imidazole-4-carboxamide isomerase [Candidatus Marinamargulisbacteria bacterium SCGC AG-414-C22]
MFNVIPAIDLLDGGIVRLTQGDYNQVTRYPETPADLAKFFEDQGATKLHIVDLNGAKEGKPVNLDIIKSIRQNTSLDIQVGGGIRTEETIHCYLNEGVNHIILGSIMVKDFNLAETLIKRFPHTIIAGLDAKNHYLSVEGWTEQSDISLLDFLKKVEHLPIVSIIYTDISKDGMMAGPDFAGLDLFANATSIKIIASGGIRGVDDLNKLKKINNLGGAIIGKAILSGSCSLQELLK